MVVASASAAKVGAAERVFGALGLGVAGVTVRRVRVSKISKVGKFWLIG